MRMLMRVIPIRKARVSSADGLRSRAIATIPAVMATGWAKDGAVHEQIDSTVEDAVSRARSRLATGPGLSECEECGEPIPEARRRAMPGARRCLACQNAHDEEAAFTGYNRRGSKDSQLR